MPTNAGYQDFIDGAPICTGCPPNTGWSPIYPPAPAWDWTVGQFATVRSYAEGYAIDAIWAMCGRHHGLVNKTVRPFWNQQLPAYLTFPSIYNPGSQGGQWAWGLVSGGGGVDLIFGGGGPLGGINGYSPPEIALPPPVYPDPATMVVTIDGNVLTPTAYRIDGEWLVRQDGQAWPNKQDLSKPTGQVNTWTVQYLQGVPVPDAANRAAGLYAIEVAKAAVQDPSCRLSQRIQNVTRQGVSASFTRASGTGLGGEGVLTGLWDIDILIKTVNPAGRYAPFRVLSPDMPQWRSP